MRRVLLIFRCAISFIGFVRCGALVSLRIVGTIDGRVFDIGRANNADAFRGLHDGRIGRKAKAIRQSECRSADEQHRHYRESRDAHARRQRERCALRCRTRRRRLRQGRRRRRPHGKGRRFRRITARSIPRRDFRVFRSGFHFVRHVSLFIPITFAAGDNEPHDGGSKASDADCQNNVRPDGRTLG